MYMLCCVYARPQWSGCRVLNTVWFWILQHVVCGQGVYKRPRLARFPSVLDPMLLVSRKVRSLGLAARLHDRGAGCENENLVVVAAEDRGCGTIAAAAGPLLEPYLVLARSFFLPTFF